MICLLGFIMLLGAGGLFWWSEYYLPHGPRWRGLILTWISAYMTIAGLLMIVFGGLPLSELWYLLGPTLILNLIGPLMILDNGRNSSPLFVGDPRKTKSKPKRTIMPDQDDDDWPWPKRKHGDG